MFKEIITKGFEFVKGVAAKVIGFISGASMVTVAKTAAGAGIVLGTAAMVIKFFKDKYAMMNSKENKQPVDQIMEKHNYADYRKRSKLKKHKKMKKVEKAIYTDKPRKKNGKKDNSFKWTKKFVKAAKKASKKKKNLGKQKTFWSRDYSDVDFSGIFDYSVPRRSRKTMTYWNAI